MTNETTRVKKPDAEKRPKRKAKKTANKPVKIWVSRDAYQDSGYDLWKTEPVKSLDGVFRIHEAYLGKILNLGLKIKPGECKPVSICIETEEV